MWPLFMSVSYAGEKGKELLLVHHLPPITLNFEYPWDYPSSQSPHFTLSCKWLSQQQVQKPY